MLFRSKKVGISNDTFSYGGSFNSRGTSVKIFFDKQNNRYKAAAPGGISIDLDPRSIDILFANNKASTELFEEISGQVLGANRLSVNDPNYPIDLVKGKQLFDAKLSPEGSYKEKEAVRKVLNYKLDQSLSNYDYNQGSQSIRLSTPSLFGKELTPRKDALRTDETFSFVYPYFENIQTKDITNLDKQLSKRQRTMEA